MASVRLDNRALIAVSGPDAEHFLHNLITADIDGLHNGTWLPSALLTAQGKVQFAFLVERTDGGFEIDCDARDAAELFKRLKFYRLRAKVDLSEPVVSSVRVVWDEPAPAHAGRDSRFGSFSVWRSKSAPSAPAEALDAWHMLRIRFGIAEPHADFAYGDVFPHDINLDQIGGVSFKKGCYVGQEVVSRMQHRGTARWRVIVAMSGNELIAGSQISAGGKPAGQIGTVSGNQGLALVRLDRIKNAIENGSAPTADDAPLAFAFPENVAFSWPETAVEG